MEQVYITAATAFAIIGAQALANWRAGIRHRKQLIGKQDAEGRIWLITDGTTGLIGGEYIEE